MFSEPIVGKNFFGREDVLGLLSKRVKAMGEGYRQNVAITGQSLAGKSSLLQHFLYTELDDSFLPVYVEVLREDFPSFANKFIATLLYNSLKTKDEAVSESLGELLAKADALLPRTAQAMRAVLSGIEKDELDEAYTNLLALTSVIHEECRKPCVVILDEFDNIVHFKVKNPFLGFGKMIMVQKDTMYIISSSRNSAIKKILQEKLSLLFGNFEVVEVKGFDTKASSEFIGRKTAPLIMDEEARRFLIYFTDGNPYYIEQVCREAKEIARERSKGSVDADSVEDAIVKLVYGANGSIHQYLTNFLWDLIDTKSRDDMLLILSSIANGHKKIRDIAKDTRKGCGEVSRALSWLTGCGLLTKSGVFTIISDRVLEFWLSHVYGKRQRMLVNYIVNRARAYKDDIRSTTADFTRESRKSPAQRVFELFHLFSNELVDIDDRQFLLPQCSTVEIKSFDDVTPYLIGTSKERRWVCQIFEVPVQETHIAQYIRNVNSLDGKVARRILVPLAGIEENAKLLAKELKISIWSPDIINMLFRLYDRSGLVII